MKKAIVKPSMPAARLPPKARPKKYPIAIIKAIMKPINRNDLFLLLEERSHKVGISKPL